MLNKSLWTTYWAWGEEYHWVDLSYELSDETPHFEMFPHLETSNLINYDSHGALVHKFNIIGQYGTHLDAPNHFVEGQRGIDEIALNEMILPLCVIDVSKEAAKDKDFTLKKSHILEWEKVYGEIPAGVFVAMRTDWWKNEDMDNTDSDGIRHFPGWSIEALEFLVEERMVTAIGHETSDTDSGLDISKNPYAAEYYILSKGKYQVEFLKNLDKVPAVGSLVFCGVPNVKNGSGFTARCIALCPSETSEDIHKLPKDKLEKIEKVISEHKLNQ